MESITFVNNIPYYNGKPIILCPKNGGKPYQILTEIFDNYNLEIILNNNK